MEDKERDFYQHLITKLFEYNTMLVTHIMGTGSMPPTPPMSMFRIPPTFITEEDLRKMPPGFPGAALGADFIKEMLDAMFKKDKDKLTK